MNGGDGPVRRVWTSGVLGAALAASVAGPTIVTARVATALLNAASCGLTFALARPPRARLSTSR
jgi:hypothetical protein